MRNVIEDFCSHTPIVRPTESFYTYKDVDFLRGVREAAESLWHSLAARHADFGKGSVTVGEGFCIYYKPKGCRKARETFIAYASNNGSLAYELTRDQIEAFLLSKGIKDFWFTWGRMD